MEHEELKNNDGYIQKVKEQNEIVEVIKGRVSLNRVGDNWVGFCIFHNDNHKPNLNVFPETQSFYCFACGVGGDVISFVMQEQSVSFFNALRSLAERKGIPFSLNGELSNSEEVKVRAVEPALREATVLYHQNLPVEVREYLRKERGLTDETIDQNLIGFCGGNTVFQTSREKLVEAGLLYENGEEYFKGYIVFPYIYQGRVIYMTGRGYPDKAHKKLPKDKVPLTQPYRGNALRKSLSILAEGEIDTLTLIQNGFNAYGIPGAKSFNSKWAEKFKKLELVYISFDGDEAGRKASKEIAQRLGSIARIIRLPEGEDVNDFFKHATADDYRKLHYEALTLAQAKIKDIPADTPITELPRVLDPIIRELAALDVTEGDTELYYTVKNHFGLNDKMIQSYGRLLKKYRKQMEEQKDTHHTQEELIEILKYQDEKTKIDPAQDYHDGTMYFTVMVNGKPYLLTSKGELCDFREAEHKGIVLRHQEVDTALFSPEGIIQFIEDKRAVDAQELFIRIKEYIKRFIVFPDERYVTYLALWVMGTYLFMVFRYFPYVWLNAEKQSGKSLLMEILSAIAFNGDLETDPTASIIYRDVACNRITMFIDEVERLGRRDQEAYGAIMAILNNGFVKSGVVKRTERDSNGKFILKRYPAYSPKMFAGINQIHDVLQDRTVKIKLLRKKESEKIDRYKERNEILRLQKELRDGLYRFALQCAGEVAELYNKEEGSIEGLGHLTNRELDVWESILALANVIDKSTGKTDITDMMRSLSAESLSEKQEDNLTNNDTYQLLMVTKAMMTEIPPLKEVGEILFFDSEKVFQYFRKTEEFEWIEKKNTLSMRLRKINIISKQERIDGVKLRVYKLNLNNFMDFCERFKI